MKKGISLRMRLTLITSLLLTTICIAVTIFSIYNVTASIVTVDEYAKHQWRNLDLEMPMYKSALDGSEFSKDLNTYFVDISTYSDTSLWFMVAAIVIGSVLMYFISGIILRPLRRLSDTIASTDKDVLSARITEYNSDDELNMLADSFNQMLERLEAVFLREQRFSAAAAHEMKTPLTVIKTNLDVLLLDENPSKEDYMESITVVQMQTERMTKLIQELLVISTAENCEKNDNVELELLIKEIFNELSFQAIEKHINLYIQTEPYKIKANRIMLKHAISNIAENAIKYNDVNGGVNCILKGEQHGCKISIIDTGIGIKDEDVLHIFEPFYRGEKSRNRKTGGCGLGLSISKEIITHHGGTITYRANSRGGSIFTIYLS